MNDWLFESYLHVCLDDLDVLDSLDDLDVLEVVRLLERLLERLLGRLLERLLRWVRFDVILTSVFSKSGFLLDPGATPPHWRQRS